jgi:hypothetical protein
METIAAVAPFIAIASGVATAGLGVVQGIQSSRAAKLEATQYEDERRTALLAADQEEVARRRRLQSILSMNEALRGSRGLAFESGSERALREANIQEAESDIGTARLNRLGQARRAELGAFGARNRETAGLFSGAGAFVSGLGTAATGALRYAPKAS